MVVVADDNEVPEVTLAQTIKNFSKRPIELLDIIKEIDVLVSLSGKGDGVTQFCMEVTYTLQMVW